MKGCEHPAEAMEFNDWFNTQVDDLASQGLVVAAKGEVETPEKMLRQFGGQDVLAELATATGDLNPDFPYAPGFSTLSKMNETAAAAVAGTASVADIFTTAQDTAVSSLKDLGLPVAVGAVQGSRQGEGFERCGEHLFANVSRQETLGIAENAQLVVAKTKLVTLFPQFGPDPFESTLWQRIAYQ